jgi:hypothetical protein
VDEMKAKKAAEKAAKKQKKQESERPSSTFKRDFDPFLPQP